MSWAAHDPEGYESCCLNGVVSKLARLLKIYGWDSLDRDQLQATIEVIAQETYTGQGPSAWMELILWAGAEVSDAESAYLTRGL